MLRFGLLKRLGLRSFAEFTPINEYLKYMRESMEKAGMVRKPLPTKFFQDVSQDIRKKLATSLKELCKDYEKRGSYAEDKKGHIQVTVKNKGTFELWINEKEQLFCLNSPISGEHQYWYEEQNEMWLSKEDLHNMLERLARELIALGPLNI